MFLSGRFDTNQFGWSTLKKDAFVVMNTLDRMHWTICTLDGFELNMDHSKPHFTLQHTCWGSTPLSDLSLNSPTMKR